MNNLFLISKNEFYLLISSIVSGLGYEDSINSRNFICDISKFGVKPPKETENINGQT